MRKLLLAGILGSALLAGTAANAASMIFEFDPSLSSIQVTDQGDCFLGAGCSVTPSLNLPAGAFAVDQGTTQSFNFATFDLSGIGWDTGVQLTATLAFIDPNVSPATSSGKASYGTFLGVFNAGKLTWTSVAPITTSNGSEFTVSFEDLKGLGAGTVYDSVDISVIRAVPEPATWAMMLLGFFGLGATLRTRRKSARAVAA